MKKRFKPSKQPKSLSKGVAPATARQSAPKPIDERQLRHVAGGAGTMLPQHNW